MSEILDRLTALLATASPADKGAGGIFRDALAAAEAASQPTPAFTPAWRREVGGMSTFLLARPTDLVEGSVTTFGDLWELKRQAWRDEHPPIFAAANAAVRASEASLVASPPPGVTLDPDTDTPFSAGDAVLLARIDAISRFVDPTTAATLSAARAALATPPPEAPLPHPQGRELIEALANAVAFSGHLTSHPARFAAANAAVRAAEATLVGSPPPGVVLHPDTDTPLSAGDAVLLARIDAILPFVSPTTAESLAAVRAALVEPPS